MSLLEDVFLEDEAGEAQELERVIEGDEYDERPTTPNSNENSEKEDEAEEDKRRVDPNQTKKVRVVKNPRFLLNPARLTGPRGIQVIPEHFKDFKFKGKGHEKDDLDMILKKLEHWAYRLYPKFKFEDCLKKIETLGKKRPVMVHLHKIRSDQFASEETVVQQDSSDDELPEPPQEEDEFDKLLQQQIELARATPAPGSVRKPEMATPRSVVSMPKATSSPSISDEQRERMLENRRKAEERRLARLKNVTVNNTITTIQEAPIIEDNEEKNMDDVTKSTDDIGKTKKHNRSNVIGSSDEETDKVTTVNHENNDDNVSSMEVTENATDLNVETNSEVTSNDKTDTKHDNENLELEKNTEEISVRDNLDQEVIKNKPIDSTEQTAAEEIPNSDDLIDETNTEMNNLQEKPIEIEQSDDKSKKVENTNSENTAASSRVTNEVILDEDLMDVDFTDDF